MTSKTDTVSDDERCVASAMLTRWSWVRTYWPLEAGQTKLLVDCHGFTSADYIGGAQEQSYSTHLGVRGRNFLLQLIRPDKCAV